MAKKETTLLQLILSLTVISVVAGVVLAAVFSKTQQPIEADRIKKKNDAIMNVLPNFDISKGKIERRTYLPEGEKDSVVLYLAYSGNQLFGAAVESYTNMAYSGTFSIIVGFDSEGTILKTEVLQANETPGLGDKIDASKDSKFAPQFVGKNPATFALKVTKDGGDVDAITASTITSRAFCDALERAYAAFRVEILGDAAAWDGVTGATSNQHKN